MTTPGQPLESVLTPEEWATRTYTQSPQAIALLNNALSDSSPYKITRQMVKDLQQDLAQLRDILWKITPDEAPTRFHAMDRLDRLDRLAQILNAIVTPVL